MICRVKYDVLHYYSTCEVSVSEAYGLLLRRSLWINVALFSRHLPSLFSVESSLVRTHFSHIGACLFVTLSHLIVIHIPSLCIALLWMSDIIPDPLKSFEDRPELAPIHDNIQNLRKNGEIALCSTPSHLSHFPFQCRYQNPTSNFRSSSDHHSRQVHLHTLRPGYNLRFRCLCD